MVKCMHCVVFLGSTLLSQCLSPPGKAVQMLGIGGGGGGGDEGLTWDGLASHLKEVAILLVRR